MRRPDRYIEVVRKFCRRTTNIDAIVVVVTPQNMTQPLELAEKLAATHNGKKPLLTAFMGGEEVAGAKEKLMAAGHSELSVARPRDGCAAGHVRLRGVAPPPAAHRHALPGQPPARGPRRCSGTSAAASPQIGEVEAKEILRAYDFNILDGHLARTADEAVEIAERIGYPVVLKISSPDIIHKSDFGGVRINLANAEQVRDAFDLMMLRIQRRAPNAHIRGGFVEKMGTRGREVILGMTRDPQFGPMLMFGLGGIFVEVMKDVTFHLAPITADEAMQMLKGTRSYALLKGARGQAPVDLDAIAGALQRISQLATDYPEITRTRHQPVHRRPGRHGSLCGRRAHDAGERATRRMTTMSKAKPSYDPAWQEKYQAANLPRRKQAVKKIRPGQRIFIGTGVRRTARTRHRAEPTAPRNCRTRKSSTCSPLATRPTRTASWPSTSASTASSSRKTCATSSRKGLGDYTPDFSLRHSAPVRLRPDAAGRGPDSGDAAGRIRHVQPRRVGGHRQERGRERLAGHRPGQPQHAAHAGRFLHSRLRH